MPRRRRSNAALPHAPLMLRHPAALPPAVIAGAEIIVEIGGADGATLFRLLRAVLAWSHDVDTGLDRETLSEMEHALLAAPPGSLSSPAGLLAGYMADPTSAIPEAVSWACVCVSDWAAGLGARRTALAYAQAAAHASPARARYAWLAAAQLLAASQVRLATSWLERCWRVAVWGDDRDAQHRAMITLAGIAELAGDSLRAGRLRLRAGKLAARHKVGQELDG